MAYRYKYELLLSIKKWRCFYVSRTERRNPNGWSYNLFVCNIWLKGKVKKTKCINSFEMDILRPQFIYLFFTQGRIANRYLYNYSTTWKPNNIKMDKRSTNKYKLYNIMKLLKLIEYFLSFVLCHLPYMISKRSRTNIGMYEVRE